MRCNICDRELSPDEIKLHSKIKNRRGEKKWEPCGSCLEAIAEVFEADSEEEIDAALNETTIEALYYPEEFQTKNDYP